MTKEASYSEKALRKECKHSKQQMRVCVSSAESTGNVRVKHSVNEQKFQKQKRAQKM